MGSHPEIEGLRIEHPLGAGAFGTVYKAWDDTFDRFVAVKVMAAPFTDDRSRREFVRECRSLGRLSDHPGIVTVHRTAQTEGDRAVLVMAFAEGGTWQDRLDHGQRMDEAGLLREGVGLADALAAAHERRVLHLDIKPANVLVSYDRPMLADFGIAKLMDRTATVTAAPKLTAAFAPPEIFDNRPPTPAADVWSLAATLCTMVVGAPPFGGNDLQLLALMAAIATKDPVDLTGHGISKPVWEVLRSCFSKDPAGRPADGGALRDALASASTRGHGVVSGLPDHRTPRAEPDTVILTPTAGSGPLPVAHPVPEMPAARRSMWRRRRGKPQQASRKATSSRSSPGTGLAAPTGAVSAALGSRTSFIGRDDDLAAVSRMLTQTRVVSLVGPGGVGKTRLAAELVAGAPSGQSVIVCELAGVGTDDQVAAALATAAGVQVIGVTPTAAVVGALAPFETLVVLDNAEHVTTGAAALVRALMEGCPRIRLLVTSRQRLGITGEGVHALAGLAHAPHGPADGEAALTAPAVQLLVQRATAADPTFTPGPEDVSLIAHLARRLEGMPLALEIVAGHVEALGLAELVRLAESGFAGLAAPDQAPPRHRTLDAVVEWSYQLLDADERRLFRRLAIFRSQWTLDDALAVAGSGSARPEMAALLARLVQRSMITAERGPGDIRYRVPEPMRAAGRRLLVEESEQEVVARRHLDWCVALVETSDVDGATELEDVVRLTAAWPDIRAAHHLALESNHVGTAARLVAGLRSLVWCRPGLWEAGEWAGELHAAGECDAEPGLHVILGWFAFFGGDLDGAHAHATRIAGLDDPELAFWAQHLLAPTHHLRGETVAAIAAVERCVALATSLGSPFARGHAGTYEVLFRTYAGEPPSADRRAQLERQVRASGNPSLWAWWCYALAEAAVESHDGGSDRADEAIRVARLTGELHLEFLARLSRVGAALRRNAAVDALEDLLVCIEGLHRSGVVSSALIAMRNAIEVLADLGGDEEAAVLLGADSAADEIAPASGDQGARLGRLGLALRSRLGADRWERCRLQGASMPSPEAVRYALTALGAALDRNAVGTTR